MQRKHRVEVTEESPKKQPNRRASRKMAEQQFLQLIKIQPTMEKLGRNIPAVYLETASTMIWVVIGRLVSVARRAIIGDLAGQTLCPVTAWKKRLAAVGLLMGSNGTGLERPREKMGHGDLLQRTHFYLCTRLMLPGEATRAVTLVAISYNKRF